MAAGRAAESSGSEAENVPVRKPTVFSRMQLSDESSSSSSEEDAVVKPFKTEEAARVQAPVVAVKVAKLPQKNSRKKRNLWNRNRSNQLWILCSTLM